MGEEKTKSSYFPHYCTMHDDQKIALIDLHFRRERGYPTEVHFGYQLYCRVLEYAASNNSDTVDLFTDDHVLVTAENLRIDPDTLIEFVEKGVEVGLFDGSKWRGLRHVTSNRMREVREMIEKRSRAGRASAEARKRAAKQE